jgi:hypothetical protein
MEKTSINEQGGDVNHMTGIPFLLSACSKEESEIALILK